MSVLPVRVRLHELLEFFSHVEPWDINKKEKREKRKEKIEKSNIARWS
jgi:hypothetical protein